MHRIVILAGSLALLAAPLAAQTVRGRVVDARTGEGVPEAAILALTAGGRRMGAGAHRRRREVLAAGTDARRGAAAGGPYGVSPDAHRSHARGRAGDDRRGAERVCGGPHHRA